MNILFTVYVKNAMTVSCSDGRRFARNQFAPNNHLWEVDLHANVRCHSSSVELMPCNHVIVKHVRAAP